MGAGKFFVGEGSDTIAVEADASICVSLGVEADDLGEYTVRIHAMSPAGSGVLGVVTYQRTAVGDLSSRWIAGAWLPGAISYRIDIQRTGGAVQAQTDGAKAQFSVSVGSPFSCPGVCALEDP